MDILRFESREAASAAVAAMIASRLEQAVGKDPATLVVSGGSTPAQCFDILSRTHSHQCWARVSVTLTDERLVPVDDPRSNEAMVRRTLLQHEAEDAVFRPLQVGQLQSFGLPAACTLLGMGEDGHIASIFPDLDTAALLDPAASPACIDVETRASDVPRRTMNLGMLLETGKIALLAFGDEKHRVLAAPDSLPVHAVLNQQRVPVRVFWAP